MPWTRMGVGKYVYPDKFLNSTLGECKSSVLRLGRFVHLKAGGAYSRYGQWRTYKYIWCLSGIEHSLLVCTPCHLVIITKKVCYPGS